MGREHSSVQVRLTRGQVNWAGATTGALLPLTLQASHVVVVVVGGVGAAPGAFATSPSRASHATPTTHTRTKCARAHAASGGGGTQAIVHAVVLGPLGHGHGIHMRRRGQEKGDGQGLRRPRS